MSARKPVITIVHGRYREPGGEDEVVESEAALLELNGWTVVRAVADPVPQGLSGLGSARRALGAIWSQRQYRLMVADVMRSGARLMHVHNLWPALSPAVIAAARAAGIPVVMTLHNYRLVCPAATLLRAGSPCETCLGRAVPWPGIVHRCYRDSRAASAAVAVMLSAHRLVRTWSRAVDRFIVPSEYAKGVFLRAGFGGDRLAVKPHFVFDPKPSGESRAAPRSGALFVGRLSAEKGVTTLMQAWQGLDSSLTVIGAGPMLDMVRGAAGSLVVSRGWQPRPAISEAMARAAYLIVPSIAPESFGRTVVEAFSHGLPVIASRRGALGEIVEDRVTGLLVEAKSPAALAQAVRWAEANPDEMSKMGRNARAAYEREYTPESNYRLLSAIYAAVSDTHLMEDLA